ncbi:hypothetical protein ACIBK8_28680 [Streptomyces sp. NPDC050161]|uniref:hypothetical protein n=1 Tax=Streptomyces sp. NPDC050161 TaxID=3365604 RepID=UPI00379E03A9
MSPTQFYWNGLRVPYVAPWSREVRRPGKFERRYDGARARLGYTDEVTSVDVRHGALWARMPAVRGTGEPTLDGVHALRQRQCMSHMFCQICGGTTYDASYDRQEERFLFLVRAPDGHPIREGERTTSPPVHAACAREAVRDCPHLRRGYTLALVRSAPLWGVGGIVHDRTTLRPLSPAGGDPFDQVSFGDPRFRWTLAVRDVVTLHGCTTVALDDLMTAA